MKILKLLVLGTLVVTVCMAVPAMASRIELAKERAVSDPATYTIGQTVHFECTVGNPSGNAETNTITGIYDTLPDGSNLWLLEPGVDDPLVQTPGQSTIFYVNYVVIAADLITLPSTNKGVINYLHADGYDTEDDVINASTSKSATVTYTLGIQVVKEADPTSLCEDSTTPITYTYTVTNEGDIDLYDILLVDDTSPCQSPTYDSGDVGDDGILGLSETWIYLCEAPTPAADVTNTATVTGYDVVFDGMVQDTDTATVDIYPAPEVTVVPASDEICEGDDPVQFCAEVVPEDTGGLYTYAWTKDGSPLVGETGDCITVSADGEYCVRVTDASGCWDEACGTLTVNPKPSCLLEAVDPPVCPSTSGNFIAAAVISGTGSYTYLWEITAGAGWAIEGGQGTDMVEYSVSDVADDCATFKLTVTDSKDCETTCELQVCCVGDTFCTFTQGYWGNAGGTKCGGKTTTQLINEALANATPAGSIMVGQAGHSITFSTPQFILNSLPAGGKPAVLPAGDWTSANITSSGLAKKNKPELNNVLIGQVVALTLNLLVSDDCLGEDSGDLASWTLPAEFCVGDNGCPKHYTIPSALVGKTVAELLAAANAALAGSTAYSLSDIYTAVTNMNEGFDECATIIACPTEEVCDNGCDDDFDGDVDCEDDDCSSDPACI